MTSEPLDAVIGLEIHVQLASESKIFCADGTGFDAQPNSQTSVISLAHPGTLPSLNGKVLEMAIMMGLACHANIDDKCVFDRKHYFYPDSPKGYQITQQTHPICRGGYIEIVLTDGRSARIDLEKIHLEDDAGKSIHDELNNNSLIDLNRAGMPLIEIVTKPVITSSTTAGLLLDEIRKIVRYLEISDGNMEEGSLRCDANISVKRKSTQKLGQKVEIKNMNSVRNVRRAIDFEISRQTDMYASGATVIAESRLYDPVLNVTSPMRVKEEADDYRYYPDPDLPPVTIQVEWLTKLNSKMPATPEMLRKRFNEEYKLSFYDISVLTSTVLTKNIFLSLVTHKIDAKSAANWVNGPVKSIINALKTDDVSVNTKELATLILLVDDKILTKNVAIKYVLPKLVNGVSAMSVEQIIQKYDLVPKSVKISLDHEVRIIIQDFPQKVTEYKNGKKSLIQLFMGELMKKTKGSIDPKEALKLFKQHLTD